MHTTPPPVEEQTPLMKQYWELKAQAPDALLFFRMGDFYELFGSDAVEASQLLEITLTSRDRNKANPMPMAGVPHHSVPGYIQKLLKLGRKIAIGEQMEDPDSVKGTKIVRREITRILTPGVHFDAEGSEVNYLAVILRIPRGKGSASAASGPGLWLLACLDASTGEALVGAPSTLDDVISEAGNLPIRHLLKIEEDAWPKDLLESLPQRIPPKTLVENLPRNYISAEKAQEILKRHYEVGDLQAFLPHDGGSLALGLLVSYALRTQQQERLAHLRLPESLRKATSMILGPNTAQHLDLPDLFALLNRTKSTLGARHLRRWLNAPLSNSTEISARQVGVQELAHSTSKIEKLSAELSKIYDLERIMGRVNTRLANPRDTLALGVSLSSLASLSELLGAPESALLAHLKSRLLALSQTLQPIASKITLNQQEEAPLTSRDGGIFKTGLHPDLDRLISLTQNGQLWLVELETREREKTGIPSLKVRYNRVFGYYIEITQAHLKNAPSHYQRKQTMVGAERFFTEELKRFEEEILTASSKQKSLEQELFQGIVDEVQTLTAPIMEAARILGELDALLSLGHWLKQPGWCMPLLDDTHSLNIELGRHPMVDAATRGQFVPNSLQLSPETRLTLLITGPNMGGKSTVMRQTALILILGQMGAPVPAARAHWGVVSSVYTRIGAQDAIARGQSTFMVEMSELAHILHHADDRSLLILDEIGRGTSTYDGISVAWATLEWIVNRIGCRTLFATHYHEMIQLASTLPLVANGHMAVEGAKTSNPSSLRFLYELRDGPTNDSFGIHVAQLAGIPKQVIQRAWKILHQLETDALVSRGSGSGNQLSLFQAPATEGPALAFSSELENGPDARMMNEFDPLDPMNDLDGDADSHSENTYRPGLKTEREPLGVAEPHPVLLELGSVVLDQLTPLQALNLVARLKELSAS